MKEDIKKQDVKDLIGTQIGVIDKNGKVTKNITITNVIQTNDGGEIFIGDDGIAYNEYDLNFNYKLTPAAIFASFLVDYNYIDSDEIFNRPMSEYDEEIKDLIGRFINSGYIENPEKE